jgi:hypothetical protein
MYYKEFVLSIGIPNPLVKARSERTRNNFLYLGQIFSALKVITERSFFRKRATRVTWLTFVNKVCYPIFTTVKKLPLLRG